MENYICRVCGYRNPDHNPFRDETGMSIHGICGCCGAESGLDDSTKEGTANYRTWWIQEGTKWFHPALKPKDWDLAKQLLRLGVDLGD